MLLFNWSVDSIPLARELNSARGWILFERGFYSYFKSKRAQVIEMIIGLGAPCRPTNYDRRVGGGN